MFHFPSTVLLCLSILASASNEESGRQVGSTLVFLLSLLGSIKCVQLMRRTTTSALCVAPLFVSLLCFLITASVAFFRASLGFTVEMSASVLCCLLLLVGLVLGVVGLALYKRGSFSQGRKQAVWGILFAGVMLAARVGVIMTSLQIQPKFQTASAASTRGASEKMGELVELPAANCRFSTPSDRWMQLKNPKALNPAATLIMRCADPNLNAVLIAESLELGSKALMEMAKSNMEIRIKTAKVANEKTQTLNGISWETAEVRLSREGGSARELTEMWVTSVAGYSYQWFFSGIESDRGYLHTAAQKIIGSFSVIDASHSSGGATPVTDATFETMGFRTKLAPLGWRVWKPEESGVNGCTLAAVHGSLAFIIADSAPLWSETVSFEDIDSVFFANYEVLKGARETAKKEPLALKGADEAAKFTVEATMADGPIIARVIIARSGKNAFLFYAWRSAIGGKDFAALDAALDTVELPTERAPLPPPQNEAAAKKQSLTLNQLGIVLSERADWPNALKAFQQAFRLSEADDTTMQNVAYAMEELGDIQGAHDWLAQHSDRLDKRVKLRSIFGRLKKKLGDFEGATSEYEKALAEGSKDEADVLAYINLLIGAEKAAEAVKFTDALVAKGGASTKVRRWQAESHESAGNAKRAMEIYDELLAKPPFDPLSAYGLGETANGEGEYDRAAAAVASLLKAGNDTVRTRLIEGWSLFGKKLWRDAKTAFEKARVFAPDDPSVASALIRTSAMLGEGDNSSVKTPIAPVPLPPALDEAMEKLARDEAIPEGSAVCYLRRASAYFFEPGKPLKSTQYRRAKIITQAGVADFSTMAFSFNPLTERIHVNRIVVTDETGKVTAEGLPEEQYVVDLSADSSEANHGKVLRVVVSGLKPGCTVDVSVTREDRSPSSEFPYERCICATTVPTLAEAVVVAGEINRIRAVLSAAMGKDATVLERKGSRAWLLRKPTVWKMESYLPFSEDYLPVLQLGPTKGDWAELGRDYLKQIDTLLKPDAKVKSLATELVGTLKTDEEKIRALTAHVQKNVTYQAIEFGRRAHIPKPAERVLTSRYGDCKDQALLLYQLCKAAGIPAQLALINSNNNLEPALPSLDQFNHMIVRLPGQKAAFVDSTNPALPACKLPPELFQRQALVLYPDKPRLEPFPERTSFPADKVTSERDITVAPDGGLTVRETLRFGGYLAMSWRGWLADVPASERQAAVQRFQSESRWRVEEFTVNGLEDNTAELIFHLRYTLPAAANSDSFSVPAIWEHGYVDVPFLKERRFPMEIIHPQEIVSHVTLHLPRTAGEESLKAFNGSGDSEFGKWKLDAKAAPGGGNNIAIEFEFTAPALKLPAVRYGEWQSFRSKIAETWRQPLKLK